MNLLNEFSVPLNVEDAWLLLTDVAKIAPCMPGAHLEEIHGDIFKGTIQIKIGPVAPVFKGHATFLSKDPVQHRAVLHVEGEDIKGQGFAQGTITASVFFESPKQSKVLIQSDLNISGRMASFGRGVFGDVSNKLFDKFVKCLEDQLR